MPNIHTALPLGPDSAWTTPVPDGDSWADSAWAWADNLIHSGWLIYGIAGLLAVLLAVSLRSRHKRAKAEARGQKADLTRTDRAITRITGILATAVVATGAWKVFGDVLHLHPAIRLVLFFFAEAQIIAAWRRVRRHIHRHAALGPGIKTIYLIAFGSALVAAFDADNGVEVLLRFFAAAVAAYMIAEELAEELDIHLTKNPHLTTTVRKLRGRIKWAHNLESVMVWLRLAQATDRTLEDVERQRRIARFSRTAYRLQVLKEDNAAKWRIRLVRWSLRRQTEAANEHLNLATDAASLGQVRSQLALLYGVEDGTSRSAVADIQPLRPPRRLAISATAFTPPAGDASGEPVHAIKVDSDPDTEDATPAATLPAIDPATLARLLAAMQPATEAATVADTEHATTDATGGATVADTATPEQRPARAPKVANTDASGSAPEAAKKLAKWVAKYPDATNAELAKRARCSERTVSRYRATAEAINLANSQPGGAINRVSVATLTTPIPEPKAPVVAGVNGNRPTFTEEN